MFGRFTLPALSINPGDLVVCHEVKGFDGGKMGARVLPNSAMHRPARDGMVWVRETGLDVNPSDAWVTEWPARLIS